MYPKPIKYKLNIIFTIKAASLSITNLLLFSFETSYPNEAKGEINSPCFILEKKALLILLDTSSKYHSLTNPFICLDFLFPKIKVSALSAKLINLIFHSLNLLFIYLSTISISLENLD